MVLCSLFLKPATVYEDNKGSIALAVSLQMRCCTKLIVIKFHHFRSFIANDDVEIKHVDTKEHITDIFMKPPDYELLGYLRFKLNG